MILSKAIPLTFLVAVSLLLVMSANTFSGQRESVGPIAEEGLLKSLGIRSLSSKELSQEVQRRGVDFHLTLAIEQDIRNAGKYLGKKGLDDLIAAIRNSYRGDKLPSVAFLYKDKQIQIYNLTENELYIWGTKLEDGPVAMEKNPRVLSPQPFFYFIEGFDDFALKQISEGGEARPVYYIFVKDKQERKFTLKCLLWTTVKDHSLTVRTQNLGVEDGWPTEGSEKTPSVINQTMTNSPGGVQAGRDVIINAAPTPRTLSQKQNSDFIMALRQSPPTETIHLGCFVGSEEACAFANQLLAAFREARWPIEGDRVDFMTGTTRGQRGVVLFKRGKPLADSPLWEVITTPTLAALKKAFSVIGIDGQITAHTSLEENKIEIYVGAQP